MPLTSSLQVSASGLTAQRLHLDVEGLGLSVPHNLVRNDAAAIPLWPARCAAQPLRISMPTSADNALPPVEQELPSSANSFLL